MAASRSSARSVPCWICHAKRDAPRSSVGPCTVLPSGPGQLARRSRTLSCRLQVARPRVIVHRSGMSLRSQVSRRPPPSSVSTCGSKRTGCQLFSATCSTSKPAGTSTTRRARATGTELPSPSSNWNSSGDVLVVRANVATTVPGGTKGGAMRSTCRSLYSLSPGVAGTSLPMSLPQLFSVSSGKRADTAACCTTSKVSL
ncbi:MAG: hypothetical protein A2138_10830 [Deltaproteobacteria bacterium RBG_16_71_12]|nr:MAG: hypothetical protein A2138_10830 [Deltaproteobacteria bacterium RBG_16_71_12]